MPGTNTRKKTRSLGCMDQFLDLAPDGAGRVRLGEIRVRAQAQGALRRGRIRVTASDEDGQVGEARLVSQPRDQFEAVHRWEVNVGDDRRDFGRVRSEEPRVWKEK